MMRAEFVVSRSCKWGKKTDQWGLTNGRKSFAFRGFLGRIIPGLARLPHRLSVLTNLSASVPTLRRFVDLVGDKLAVVSASLHLEYVTMEAFLAKAQALHAMLRPETTLVVNNVLVPGTLDGLVAVRRRIEAAGLRYFPQVLKTKHGVYAYATADEPRLLQLLGHHPQPHEANVAPSYRGRLCWTGVQYFVLDQRGHAWGCRTAKRGHEGYLGNVLDGTFALRSVPRPCAYDICPCTVPANRGMIAGIGRRSGSGDAV